MLKVGKSIYLLAVLILSSCSNYPEPFTSQPNPPQFDQYKKYSKTEALRLLEQIYAFWTINALQNEKSDQGNAGAEMWNIISAPLDFHRLPITERQAFLEELVNRYGIGSVFIDITPDGRDFISPFEWAKFIKNNESKMTPAADYSYRKYYIKRIENILKTPLEADLPENVIGAGNHRRR